MKNEFEKFDKDNPFFSTEHLEHIILVNWKIISNGNPEHASVLKKSCKNGNIDYPELVEKIHHEYIDAGVNAIKSNTFGANQQVLIFGSLLHGALVF